MGNANGFPESVSGFTSVDAESARTKSGHNPSRRGSYLTTSLRRFGYRPAYLFLLFLLLVQVP